MCLAVPDEAWDDLEVHFLAAPVGHLRESNGHCTPVLLGLTSPNR